MYSTGKLFLILLSLVYGCTKNNENCIKARVVRISCAGIVVQVLNQDSLGDYGWRDVSSNIVYNNVFSVKNTCDIGTRYKGEEIYFSLRNTPAVNECISCMMFDAPPRKSFLIENVTRKHCK
ncbi:MAG: hypothetical protein WKF89_02345 [Chitinophagaceae bacterium]